MKSITIPATVDQMQQILDLINLDLTENDCSLQSEMQINIAVEELFVNICHYAYHPETGAATVQWEVTGDPPCITIQFLDAGHPYNPLEKEDPDTTLSVEDRNIGGLGVYLVKKTMDHMSYEYKDGRNTLTIQKTL